MSRTRRRAPRVVHPSQEYLLGRYDGRLDRLHEHFESWMNALAHEHGLRGGWLSHFILDAHLHVYRQRVSYRQRLNAIRQYWWFQRKTIRARMREALWREIEMLEIDDLNDERFHFGGPIGCRRPQYIRRLRRPQLGDWE